MNAHSDQLTVLEHYRAAFVDLGFETRVAPALPDVPDPLLTVGLPRDAAGRDRLLHIGFLPLAPEDDLDHLTLLQWYTPLPFAPARERSGLERLLAKINTHTTLGYFGLIDDAHLFHRHMHATPRWALPDPQSIQQTAVVFVHMQDVFAPLIEAVIAGAVSLEAGLAQL